MIVVELLAASASQRGKDEGGNRQRRRRNPTSSVIEDAHARLAEISRTEHRRRRRPASRTEYKSRLESQESGGTEPNGEEGPKTRKDVRRLREPNQPMNTWCPHASRHLRAYKNKYVQKNSTSCSEAGGGGCGGGGGCRTPPICSGKVHEKAEDSFVSSVLLREVCQLVSRGRGFGGTGPSDDPVGQEVAQRHGDRQSLHLLRALRPAEGHPAQVLQAGNAAGTLPEMHAPVAGPASKHTPHQSIRAQDSTMKERPGPRGGRTHPAARTLPVVEKAQQRPLGRKATA